MHPTPLVQIWRGMGDMGRANSYHVGMDTTPSVHSDARDSAPASEPGSSPTPPAAPAAPASPTVLATLAERLGGLAETEVRQRVSLATLGRWRIGGPVDLLVEPLTPAAVAACRAVLHEAPCPVVVIGEGSNLLFADAGLRGVALKIGARMRGLDFEGTRVIAEAGLWAPRLALLAARRGLAGLEHIVGIPGTLGGLVAMNGGSLRHGIGDVIEWVEGVDGSGATRRFAAAACGFAYRTSRFQKEDWVLTRAELRLQPDNPVALRRRMLEICRERRAKFPHRAANCGSTFQSSPALYEAFGPPGKVIEETGLKGLRRGAAEVSARHANFINNLGSATAREVLALIAEIRARVQARTSFAIECEVRYVSEDGVVAPAHVAVDRIQDATA